MDTFVSGIPCGAGVRQRAALICTTHHAKMAGMPESRTAAARAAKAQAALNALPPGQARLLERLAAKGAKENAAVEKARAAADETLAVVAACRDAGLTWDLIAAALGVQQSNAVTKYRPLLQEIRRVRVRPGRATDG